MWTGCCYLEHGSRSCCLVCIRLVPKVQPGDNFGNDRHARRIILGAPFILYNKDEKGWPGKFLYQEVYLSTQWQTTDFLGPEAQRPLTHLLDPSAAGDLLLLFSFVEDLDAFFDVLSNLPFVKFPPQKLPSGEGYTIKFIIRLPNMFDLSKVLIQANIKITAKEFADHSTTRRFKLRFLRRLCTSISMSFSISVCGVGCKLEESMLSQNGSRYNWFLIELHLSSAIYGR